MAENIINGLRKLPVKYKIIAVISVFIMSSYGLSVLVSGGAPTARLSPEEITVSPGESANFSLSVHSCEVKNE